jgi:hypothetical protein
VTRSHLLLPLLLTLGCGGTWETGGSSAPIGKSAPAPGTAVPVKHQEPVQADTDGGPPAAQHDAGPTKPDAKPKSTSPAPDAMPPDSSPPAPQPPKSGGPCPCAAGQICISQVCRATCAAPAGSCNATSTCAASEACLEVKGTGSWVCLPAVAPGAACGQGALCPNGHVCGSVNGGAFHCLPTCQAGKACAQGNCLPATAGCSFCTAL